MSELSTIQRWVRMFVSEARFAAIEAESRSWMMGCSICRHEQSIWEMGGIRYKAAGNPRMYRICPNCGQRAWQRVYKK